MHIILGLQLVFLINLSQSFVLLTANMEDVRKLAKKFVSESLAEQIADFIAKVSSNAVENVANVSEENEQNDDIYKQMSNENFLRNNKIARQRSPKLIEPKPQPITIKTTKYEQITTHKTVWPIHHNKKPYRPKKTSPGPTKQQSYNKWSKKQLLPENQPDLNKSNKGDKVEKIKEYRQVKKTKDYRHDEKTEEYYQDMSADAKPVQDLQVTAKTTKEHRKPRKKQGNKTPPSIQPNIDSTLGYAEGYEIYDSLNPNPHRFARVDSNEFNYTQETNVTSSTYPNYAGFNIARGEQELTTEKENNEFDQYDNIPYPKSEFVATSGPVALPKMPSQSQFWDKDISEIERSKEHSRKRKAWF